MEKNQTGDNDREVKPGRNERTYARKAVDMAREIWEKERKKAIHQRRVFRGLQIVPTTSFLDESQGHTPGENNW